MHQSTAFHNANFSTATRAVYDEAANSWSTLKLHMNGLQKHPEELMFFAYEMRVRGQMAKWPVNWLYGAYEALSDWARSVVLPLSYMAYTATIAFLAYVWVIGKPGAAATLALAHAVPFVGPSRGIVTEMLKEAFPGGVPFLFSVATTMQSVISAVLIFLIVLALRNRFRIK